MRNGWRTRKTEGEIETEIVRRHEDTCCIFCYDELIKQLS